MRAKLEQASKVKMWMPTRLYSDAQMVRRPFRRRSQEATPAAIPGLPH